jgi:uncharacterized membrane protein YhhN
MAILMALAVAALLVAERLESTAGIWIAKPLASAVFVAAAVAAGASSNAFGRIVLVALALCWIGDVFLIPHSHGAFLAGIAAFLLGHLAFIVAFIVRGEIAWRPAIALIPITLFGALVFARLRLSIPRGIVGAVAAYIATICVMVAAAAGTMRGWTDWRIACGAAAFFVSDLSVARDRFVRRSFVNRLWGLPLYYAAQLLFAFAAGRG